MSHILHRMIEDGIFIDSVVTDPGCIPSVEFWQLVIRVLKPGGHVLSFGDVRSYHRMVVNLEDAGFEIRDQIAWMHGSSMEPVVLGRKPIEEGTVSENVLKYGTGGINVDACRIGTLGGMTKPSTCEGDTGTWQGNRSAGKDAWIETGGRFPANVILDEAAGAQLDEQSGYSKTPSTVTRGGHRQQAFGMGEQLDVPCFGDSGGASRFFYRVKPDEIETNGRFPANVILDEVAGAYCAAKPINLMRYLCRLITPPGGTVLDLFALSEVVGEAAELEGFNSISILTY